MYPPMLRTPSRVVECLAFELVSWRTMSDSHPNVTRGKTLKLAEYSAAGYRFYHVSPFVLPIGQIFSPTTYKSRPHYELFRNPPKLELLSDPGFESYRQLEAIFEEARNAVAATAPQRSRALYAFVCLECAHWFSQFSRKGAPVYEIEIEPSADVFISDLVWRNMAASVLKKPDRFRESDFPFQAINEEDAARKTAEAYWKGSWPSQSRPEALIDGEVKIGHQC
jgi:hypothetical protein